MSEKQPYEKVSSAKELSEFIMQLKEDFCENKDEWENCTIEQYLDAVSACIKDHDYNSAIELTWPNVASFFEMGKYYE